MIIGIKLKMYSSQNYSYSKVGRTSENRSSIPTSKPSLPSQDKYSYEKTNLPQHEHTRSKT